MFGIVETIIGKIAGGTVGKAIGWVSNCGTDICYTLINMNKSKRTAF